MSLTLRCPPFAGLEGLVDLGSRCEISSEVRPSFFALLPS
jgi:hypothetical protein